MDGTGCTLAVTTKRIQEDMGIKSHVVCGRVLVAHLHFPATTHALTLRTAKQNTRQTASQPVISPVPRGSCAIRNNIIYHSAINNRGCAVLLFCSLIDVIFKWAGWWVV